MGDDRIFVIRHTMEETILTEHTVAPTLKHYALVAMPFLVIAVTSSAGLVNETLGVLSGVAVAVR